MRLLFVCTGNICRSPTAEAVARHWISQKGLAEHIEVDSAGTHGIHAGEAPDARSQRAAARRGYDMRHLRARQIRMDDFERFDLLLAMTEDHAEWLRRHSPAHCRDKIHLFLEFLPGCDGGDVPDPYYGGEHGFEHVLSLCEETVASLIDHFQARWLRQVA